VNLVPCGANVVSSSLVKRLPNIAGRLPDDERGRRRALCRQGAQPEEARHRNYAQGRFHTNRIGRMVRETATMEFVVTRTETEALLLEANLIKRLRPRFNVLMRDDKSFPYILLTPTTGCRPASSSIAARATARATISARSPRPARSDARSTRCSARSCCAPAPIRCSRAARGPCLLYQIKRCSAPCTGEISEPTMPNWSKEAKDFLSGRSQRVKEEISEAMQQAAEKLDFERAALYRDRLRRCRMCRAIRASIRRASKKPTSSPSIRKAGRAASRCSSSAPARTGATAPISRRPTRRLSRRSARRVLAQFYDDKPCPRLILLSHEIEEQDLLAEALSRAPAQGRDQRAAARRKQGPRRHALQNAREALGRRLAETSTQARLLEWPCRDIRAGRHAAPHRGL
jgi:excinuclease ABC subunit C